MISHTFILEVLEYIHSVSIQMNCLVKAFTHLASNGRNEKVKD